MSKEQQVLVVEPPDGIERSSFLTEAFKTLVAIEKSSNTPLKPVWISQDDCISGRHDGKGKIYVCDPFRGQAFEYLKGHGNRIIGPLCITACLNHNMDLPRKKIPIYNLAMKGLKICFTSLEKEMRETLSDKVLLMGGEVEPSLTKDTTHLVVGEVGSNKYMIAVENKKVVTVTEWVTKMWEMSQTRHLLASEEYFDKFMCPPFLGLTIVISGFTNHERNQLKGYITKGGGKFSGELKQKECAILIVKKPEGAKYKAAKSWKITIVNEKWLYSCMDKKQYLDPSPYKFENVVKTSSPERRSVAGPNFADVSAISVGGSNSTFASIDETVDITMRNNQSMANAKDIGETRLECTIGNDLTVAPADVFLDDCKIYFTGLRSALEVKLRKIVLNGGGLSAPALSENVTHVVTTPGGDIPSADLAELQKLSQCPYVVTSQWLMDCVSMHTHVKETNYLRQDLGLNLPADDDVPKDFKKPALSKPGSSTTNNTSSSSSSRDVSKQLTSQDDHNQEAASDLEMADLLSQYLEPAESTTISNDKGGDGDKEDNQMPQEETTLQEEATQEPSEMDRSDAFFASKTFIILGFVEEEAQELAELIEMKGGKVYSSGVKRKVIDIAIVPLMGFQVEVTVSEILTNAWLQMCIEAEQSLDYDAHWSFRPLDLPDSTPLTGCVISVSGYVGVERECIQHLAQSLGAVFQDHLARKASSSMKANTHLIVADSSASKKYDAARKWKLHTIGNEWLLACASKNKHVAEDEFDIVVIEQKQQQCDMSDETLERSNNHTIDAGNGSKTTKATSLELPDLEPGPSTPGPRNSVTTSTPVIDKQSREGDKLSSPQVSRGKDLMPGEQVPSSSVESGGISPITNPMAQFQKSAAVAAPSIQTPELSSRSSPRRPSTPKTAAGRAANQSVSSMAAASGKTPTTDLRRQVLQSGAEGATVSGSSSASAPAVSMNASTSRSPGTPLGLTRGGGVSPGTFLQPGYKPKFNFKGCFDTPDQEDKVDLNESTPLGEVFARQIKKFHDNTERDKLEHADDNEPMASQSGPDQQSPLHGVVIAVAKKLGKNHEEYNGIAVELGGDFSWLYHDNVTHFIFEGKLNDTNKEFRKARDDGKLIVSPHWLHACKEQNERVDESQFPHNYNPRQCLAITPRATPRSTRGRAVGGQSSGATNSSSSSSRNDLEKTPGKAAAGGNKAPPVLNIMKEERSSSPALRRTTRDTKAAREASSRHKVNTNDDEGDDGPKETSPSENIEPRRSARERLTETAASSPLKRTRSHNSTADTTDNNDTQKSTADQSKNQEMKKTLTETLGNVLANDSRSNRGKTRKGKRLNLSGQLSASDCASNDCSPWSGVKGGKGELKTPEVSASDFDLPQSVQITWDDPTGRLEEEKLAHRLARVCEPSQSTQNNTEDMMMAAMDVPMESMEAAQAQLNSDRSPTPEPPSLAFPVTRPASRVLSPQPVELLSEESSDSRLDQIGAHAAKSPPIILLSGMANEEKYDYSALVEQLGGKILEQQHFEPNCTHLIISQPTRNEKFLACIASGKWVLHKSYLEACRKEGKFVSECGHEWGSEFTLPLMQNMTATANKLAAAAHKWRKKMDSLKKYNAKVGGAFDDWKVLLCLDKNKQDNFSRLLSAGGAKVTCVRPPFSNEQANDNTHAFIDLNKVKIPEEDLEKLIRAQVHCLKAEFIPAYLTDDAVPEPSDFYPPQVVSLRASMPEATSRKRQLSSHDAKQQAAKAQKR